MRSYELFMDQKDRFVGELQNADKNILVTLNPINLNKYNRGNWFMVFNPRLWGRCKMGFGVNYSFQYYRDKISGEEYVRLPVGVENPFKCEYRRKFKEDVIEYISRDSITIPKCDLWPNVGFGKRKMIEPQIIELNRKAWKKALDTYMNLGEFNHIVAEIIKQYNARGGFIEGRYLPA